MRAPVLPFNVLCYGPLDLFEGLADLAPVERGRTLGEDLLALFDELGAVVGVGEG